MAFFCELILNPWWNLCVAGALNNRAIFQALQTFTEGLWADALEGALKFAKTHLPLFEIADDEWGPLVADQISRAGHRTTMFVYR